MIILNKEGERKGRGGKEAEKDGRRIGVQKENKRWKIKERRNGKVEKKKKEREAMIRFCC